MSEFSIQTTGIHKSFGSHRVLQDVSLQISAGQTFALLGRNGAGKTTLIRTLLGLLTPDAGSVRLAGLDPTLNALEVRSRVGYLAEDQTMYGWMTPLELCRFLAPFYPTWDMDLAHSYLQRLAVPSDTRINRLSKGQTVKLGLLIALAHRPRVVILDDPAMGLDPIARKEFNRDLVEHLQGCGCTVLYSSHLLGEVEAVADAVAILDQGRLLRTGLTDQLRQDVKQVIIPLAQCQDLPRPDTLLDVKRTVSELAFVVDQADVWLRQLSSRSIQHEVLDLNLDEIFEAFVIGRKSDWPEQTMSKVVPTS